MSSPAILYLLVAMALAGFWILLGCASLRERAWRAAGISWGGLMLTIAASIFLYAVLQDSPALLLLLALLPPIVLGVLFLPLGSVRTLAIRPRTERAGERVDERDVIFAREEYLPGSEKYTVYYERHPELRALDDRIRALPPLLEPGGYYYDTTHSSALELRFEELEALTPEVDGPVAPQRKDLDAQQATDGIKTTLLRAGADAVGIAELDPAFVYTHVGRGPEPWGTRIEQRHRYAIAFTLEMDFDHVVAAPTLAITEETATQYLRGARISIALARRIRDWGHPARAHIAGSNYQVMLPPIAHAAGLGELGRLGYLISPRLGPRVRLGVVTTDLPLVSDRPIAFGVQDFCDRCRKCARNCPSGAIPHGAPRTVRGVTKWPLGIEACLSYWRQIGTDCGLCMRVCPYSHPPTFIHNLVRAAVRRSAVARALAVWGDDLLYGRRIGARPDVNARPGGAAGSEESS